jgi:hypothetical protein
VDIGTVTFSGRNGDGEMGTVVFPNMEMVLVLKKMVFPEKILQK